MGSKCQYMNSNSRPDVCLLLNKDSLEAADLSAWKMAYSR